MSNAPELTTPQLVREYRDLHVAAALNNHRPPAAQAARLADIVDELRARGVLD